MVRAVRSFDTPEARDVDQIARDAIAEELSERVRQNDRAAGAAATKLGDRLRGRGAGGGPGVGGPKQAGGRGAFSLLAQINVFNRILSLLPPEISSAIQGAQLVGDIADVIPVVGRPAGLVAGAGLGAALAFGQRIRDEERERRIAQIANAGPAGLESIGVDPAENVGKIINRVKVFLKDPTSLDFSNIDQITRIFNDIGRLTDSSLAQFRAYTDAIAARKDLTAAADIGVQAFYNASPNFIPPTVSGEITELHENQKARLNSIPTTPRERGG